MSIVVSHDGGDAGHGLRFVVGERRLQHLLLTSSEPQRTVIFKVQCTASRKFRVRPTMGMIAPRASTTVHIQLSPLERECATCKLLVSVRSVVNQDMTLGFAGGPGMTAHPVVQTGDAQLKRMWQATEVSAEETLVHSETVLVQIVQDEAVKLEVEENPLSQLNEEPAYSSKLIARQSGQEERSEAADHRSSPPKGTAGPSEISLAQPISIQQRAQIVALLMKNQSHRPRNKLTAVERDLLRQLRAHDTSNWVLLNTYAARLRGLMQQYHRQPHPMSKSA